MRKNTCEVTSSSPDRPIYEALTLSCWNYTSQSARQKWIKIVGLMRARPGPVWGQGKGVFQRARFSAGWLNGLVLVKLGCSHVFMNEQEISRVISKKSIWLRITLLQYQSCKGNISSWRVTCSMAPRTLELACHSVIRFLNYLKGEWQSLPVLLTVVLSQLCSSTIKMNQTRISLAVQWLTLCTPNSRGAGSIPGWGSKIPHATWCGKK